MTDINRHKIVYDHLKEIRAVWNQEDFSKKINKNKGTVSLVMSGKEEASADFSIKVCKVFPTINLAWLLTGEGEMIQEPKEYNGLAEKSLTTVEDPSSKVKCEICKEKDRHISAINKSIADKDKEIEKLYKQVEHLNGQITFLQHIIESQCFDRPPLKTGTEPP